MHGFFELDLGSRFVVFEETASIGLIFFEQRTDVMIADLAPLDLLHSGAHNGGFYHAVGRKHLVAEPVQTLILFQVMETITKFAINPFSNRIKLFAQIIQFSRFRRCGRWGDQKTTGNGRYRKSLAYSSHTDHRNNLLCDRYFQSGMLPCLRGGLVSRLFSNSLNARISFCRVNLGSITSSINPRS